MIIITCLRATVIEIYMVAVNIFLEVFARNAILVLFLWIMNVVIDFVWPEYSRIIKKKPKQVKRQNSKNLTGLLFRAMKVPLQVWPKLLLLSKIIGLCQPATKYWMELSDSISEYWLKEFCIELLLISIPLQHILQVLQLSNSDLKRRLPTFEIKYYQIIKFSLTVKPRKDSNFLILSMGLEYTVAH